MESSIVIKVKYGETLRRFNARVADDKLGLNIDGLRDKICQLFNFPPGSELTLTYIDEDDDVVTLVDDEDLLDITRQDLDPLRISVRLNTEKLGRSSGTSPLVQPTFPNIKSSVSDLLKSLPKSKSRKILKHSADMASKAASAAREIGELSKALSMTSLSYLKQACPVSGVTTGTVGSGEPSQAEIAEKLSFKTAGQPKTHTGSLDASKLKSFQPDQNGIQCESLSKSPKPDSCPVLGVTTGTVGSGEPSQAEIAEKLSFKTAGQPKIRTGSIYASKLKSFQQNQNGIRCESLSKSPKLNSSLVDCKKEEGNKFGDCHLVGKALGISNSSASTTGPEKRADKQPSENHFGPEPAGAVVSPGMLSDGFRSPSLYTIAGVPVVKNTVQPQYSPFPIPIGRSHSHSDRTGSIVHRGVRCDGCGVHPITGPRFNSKVKEDYDLCSICFMLMGEDADYIRMDHPVAYQHPHVILRGCGVKSPKLDSRFTQDVNVLDGTIMAPLTRFTKVWRMRNNGNIVWPQGTRLVWIAGDRFSDAFSVELQITSVGLAVDHDLDVAVDFTAPELPGRYISYWRMTSPSGEKFGQRVWVLIQVDFSMRPPKKEFLCEASLDLNLNFPPASNDIAGCETIKLNADTRMEDIIPDPTFPNPTMELVELVVDGKRNKDQESKSCISPAAAGSSISYPIDLSEAAPAVTSAAPPSVTEVRASSQDDRENSDTEMTLLKELDAMGFKQASFNKEVLRMNEYDLEQSVDDLCGVAEWDPILEELEEMGFHNKEMNKKLLKKNYGSIKRVVMDLLAGEN